MKKFVSLVVLCLASTSIFAANEYYSISRSIRSLGMGGAFYGLSDDEYALFYNPAGLANYRGDGEFMFSLGATTATATLSAMNKVTGTKTSDVNELIANFREFDGKPIYAGANIMPYYHRKNFAIALLVGDVKAGMTLSTTNAANVIDLTTISDSGLLVGMADEYLGGALKVGANLKGILRAGAQRSYSAVDLATNPDFNIKQVGGAGFGVDADVGAILDIPGVPFGIENQASITINNLFASDFSIGRTDGPPPGLVRTLSLGYQTVLPGWKAFDQFRLMIDFAEFSLGGEEIPNRGARTGDFFKHVNLGVETPITSWFYVRTGLHQGGLTFGIGLYSWLARLDLATFSEELGQSVGSTGSRRIALRLAIGIGSTPPIPVGRGTVTPEKPKDEILPTEVKDPTVLDEKKPDETKQKKGKADEDKTSEEDKPKQDKAEEKKDEKLEDKKEEKTEPEKKSETKSETKSEPVKEEPKSEADKKLETLED